MGSFLTQCFVTQQAINEQAECMIVPIKQTMPYQSLSYRFAPGQDFKEHLGPFETNTHFDSFWEPASLPLEATYEDCGSFILKETEYNKLAAYSLIELLVSHKIAYIQQGENEYHDHEVNFPEEANRLGIASEVPNLQYQQLVNAGKDPLNLPKFTWILSLDINSEDFWPKVHEFYEYFEKMRHQGRILVQHYNGHPRNLDLAVVHGRTIDEVIKLQSDLKSWSGNSLSYQSMLDQAVPAFFEEERLHNRIIALYAERDSKKAAGQDDSELRTELREVYSKLQSFQSGTQAAFYQLGTVNDNYVRMGQFAEFCEMLKKTLQLINNSSEKESTLKMLLAPLVRFKQVAVFCDNCNVKLSPMVYSGQDYANEGGQRFAALVSATAQAIRKDWQNEYGEEFDDDENDNEDKDIN